MNGSQLLSFACFVFVQFTRPLIGSCLSRCSLFQHTCSLHTPLCYADRLCIWISLFWSARVSIYLLRHFSAEDYHQQSSYCRFYLLLYHHCLLYCTRWWWCWRSCLPFLAQSRCRWSRGLGGMAGSQDHCSLLARRSRHRCRCRLRLLPDWQPHWCHRSPCCLWLFTVPFATVLLYAQVRLSALPCSGKTFHSYIAAAGVMRANITNTA